MDGTGCAAPDPEPQQDEPNDPQVERIAHVLTVVLGCLREHFPDDYFRRCAFAARGIRALLDKDGIDGHAVGGRFTALAVARFGPRYALQGFTDSPEPYPHLWVETPQRLIDLGPYLLPYGSPFPIVAMPPLIWDRAEPLPAALRYEPIDVVSDDAPFSVDLLVAREAEAFVTLCMDHCADEARFPHWIATGRQALDRQIDDRWVQGVRHFEQVVNKLPGEPH